ncbi:hypothetical protein D3C81_2036890 [compost metagenome]
MEKITITIKTAGAAFEGYETHELARILHKLAEQIEHNGIPTKLLDINGNKCGTVETE